MWDMQGPWQRGKASAALFPPGYCHGSEWLIGNETRAGDCAVMAAELCPWGYVVRYTRATFCLIMFAHFAEFVKTGQNKNCTLKQAQLK